MLVNEKKAAEFLGTTAGCLRVLRAVGKRGENGMEPITYAKLGRSVRYDTRDLEQYVAARKVAG